MLRKCIYTIAVVFIFTGMANTFAYANDSAITEAASPPKWLEQRQNAASFASDWLTDLDHGNYAEAAKSYKVDADPAESAKQLSLTREKLGSMSSRSYKGAAVTAVANDESEMKIRVAYETEFSTKTVHESVEVLIWPKAPVILNYELED